MARLHLLICLNQHPLPPKRSYAVLNRQLRPLSELSAYLELYYIGHGTVHFQVNGAE